MINKDLEAMLSGIRYGLKEILPSAIDIKKRANILKAVELDEQFQLGIFSEEEKMDIICNEKDRYFRENKNVKRLVKDQITKKR